VFEKANVKDDIWKYFLVFACETKLLLDATVRYNKMSCDISDLLTVRDLT